MSQICQHCKRTVDEFEGIVDEFIWYHMHCYFFIKTKRKNKLQNKFDGKTIILEEAEELSELNVILLNVKKFINAPTITTGQVFGATNPRVFGKSEGMLALDQHIDELKKHKEIEAARTDKPEQLPHGKNKVFEIMSNTKH